MVDNPELWNKVHWSMFWSLSSIIKTKRWIPRNENNKWRRLSIDRNSLGALWIFFFSWQNSMAFRQEHQYTNKDSHPVTEACTSVWSESLLILFFAASIVCSNGEKSEIFKIIWYSWEIKQKKATIPLLAHSLTMGKNKWYRPWTFKMLRNFLSEKKSCIPWILK